MAQTGNLCATVRRSGSEVKIKTGGGSTLDAIQSILSANRDTSIIADNERLALLRIHPDYRWLLRDEIRVQILFFFTLHTLREIINVWSCSVFN